MKTKYVFCGLFSLYVNFYNNRTMWSTNLHGKICRWGEKEKEPDFFPYPPLISTILLWYNEGSYKFNL